MAGPPLSRARAFAGAPSPSAAAAADLGRKRAGAAVLGGALADALVVADVAPVVAAAAALEVVQRVGRAAALLERRRLGLLRRRNRRGSGDEGGDESEDDLRLHGGDDIGDFRAWAGVRLRDSKEVAFDAEEKCKVR